MGVFNLLAVRINQRVPLVDKPEGFIKAGDGEFNDAVVSLVKPRGLCVNDGPDPRKVDTSGVSYAAWVSVADVSASKSSGARRLHQ